MAVNANKNASRPQLGRPTPLNISLNKGKNDVQDLGLGVRFFTKLTEHRDKICQVDVTAGFTESRGAMLNRSIQVAVEMQARGLQENDVVLICSKSHCDQTIVILSSLLIGAVIAPIDPDTPMLELNNILICLKPKFIFCDARNYGLIENMVRHLNATLIISFGVHVDRMCFDKLLVNKIRIDFKPVVVMETRNKIAFIVPTQAVSGPPKLVCLSHHTICLQIAHADTILRDSEKVLSYFPLCWIPQVILVCYCFESLMVRIIPGEFQEKLACKLIHDLRIDTAIFGTHYAMLLVNHPSLQDYDISCLQYIYVGGTATSAMEMAHLRAGFPAGHIFQCYGLTELGGLVCGFSKDEYDMALTKPGSVGKPLPSFKIKIIDQTGLRTKPGKRGEIQVTGPSMMLGYYNKINLTQNAIVGGYFKTGDIGMADENGFIYVNGRTSDHIILNGITLLPTDIEQIIRMHPCVIEAVVVGDTKETIACIVKFEDSELTSQMLLDFLNERLPKSKIPTRFKFMDSIPKTSAGKVKRTLLKQTHISVSIRHSKSIVGLNNSEAFQD